jgi:protein TonB
VDDRRPTDPLLAGKETRGQTIARWAFVLSAALLVHLLAIGVAWLVPSSESADEEGDSTVEVAVVEKEPEPPEPPQPDPEPEPPPEPPEKPPEEPAPEPEPQPPEPREPEPEPEPTPKPEPQPKEPPPEPDPDRQESAQKEAESMKAVELEGLTMESTVEGGEGPTMKVGKGIESGKITDNYVDPDRMDSIQTGDGDGAGRGGSDTPGTGSAPRNCPEQGASVKNKVRVSPDDYPMQAKRRGIEGEIVGLVTVSTDGSVQSVEIVEGLGSGLDGLAREAFQQWTFEPARRDCQAVRSKVRVRHRFNLTN